jgi:hypothetical protein
MFWKTSAGAALVLVIVVAIISMNSCSGLEPKVPGKRIQPDAALKPAPEPKADVKPEPEPAQAEKSEPKPKPAPKPEPEPDPKSILLDPNDMSQQLSYWGDTKEGDWVRFLNWKKDLIIYKVVKRDGDTIKLEVKQYTREGKEIPEEEPDIRQLDVAQDDRIMRDSLNMNPYIERSVSKWQLYGSAKTLHCERHWVPNPMTGDNNETLRSRDVRCGGLVFMRRGNTTYVILVDYGDAQHPPKWDNLKPAELLKYWQKHDRFLNEKPDSQNDPAASGHPQKPQK